MPADGTRASIDACDEMGEGFVFDGLDEMTELFIIFYFESSANPRKKSFGELAGAGANWPTVDVLLPEALP